MCLLFQLAWLTLWEYTIQNSVASSTVSFDGLRSPLQIGGTRAQCTGYSVRARPNFHMALSKYYETDRRSQARLAGCFIAIRSARAIWQAAVSFAKAPPDLDADTQGPIGRMFVFMIS